MMNKKHNLSSEAATNSTDLTISQQAESVPTPHKRTDEIDNADKTMTRKMLTHEEAQRLHHELQLCQIELRMCNEELRRTQGELETLRMQHHELHLTDSDQCIQAEAEVRREEALLRCLIDSVGDLIFIKDMNGVYKACNKASEEFVGLSECEQIGKTDFDFFD